MHPPLMMAQSRAESTWDIYNVEKYINQFLPNSIKSIRQCERINKKICRQKMSIMFNEMTIIYIYIYIHMRAFNLQNNYMHLAILFFSRVLKSQKLYMFFFILERCMFLCSCNLLYIYIYIYIYI